jgi:hypothetical protein
MKGALITVDSTLVGGETLQISNQHIQRLRDNQAPLLRFKTLRKHRFPITESDTVVYCVHKTTKLYHILWSIVDKRSRICRAEVWSTKSDHYTKISFPPISFILRNSIPSIGISSAMRRLVFLLDMPIEATTLPRMENPTTLHTIWYLDFVV